MNLLRRRFGSLERLGTFLLALILAIVVWAVSEQQQNPFETRTFARLPVEARGLSDTLVFAEGSTTFPAVDVRVRAPRSILDDLTTANLDVFIDLSDAAAGRQELPIEVDSTMPNVDVQEIVPASVVVRLEERIEREIPVVANILDSPPFGYEAGTPVIDPPTVTVSGPSSLVTTVQRAEVTVRLLDARSEVQVTEFITLRNRNGSTVTRVDAEPRTVSVSVPINQIEGVREISVVPRIVGQPAPGYQWVGVSVDPTSVRIIGDPESLDVMPNFIETIPLDIEGATDDVEERVPLVVDESVSVLAAQAVMVRVDIEPIRGSLTLTLRPMLQGLAPGLAVESISPETIDVILLGPLPRLQTITADLNAQAILQVSNLSEGTYDLTPILVLPEGVTEQAVLPDTVRVIIVVSATPTPTATPGGATPTPTSTGTGTGPFTTPTGTPVPRATAGIVTPTLATPPSPPLP